MATEKFHNQLIARFQNFRSKLHNCFQLSSDACMDLLDALAGNTGAKSIAELSLNPLFNRGYSSVYKAIKESFDTTSQQMNDQVEDKIETPNNFIILSPS